MHVDVDDVEMLAPPATAASMMLFRRSILSFPILRIEVTLLGFQDTFEQHHESSLARRHADRFPALDTCRIKYLVATFVDRHETILKSIHHSCSVRTGGESTRNRR